MYTFVSVAEFLFRLDSFSEMIQMSHVCPNVVIYWLQNITPVLFYIRTCRALVASC